MLRVDQTPSSVLYASVFNEGRIDAFRLESGLLPNQSFSRTAQDPKTLPVALALDPHAVRPLRRRGRDRPHRRLPRPAGRRLAERAGDQHRSARRCRGQRLLDVPRRHRDRHAAVASCGRPTERSAISVGSRRCAAALAGLALGIGFVDFRLWMLPWIAVAPLIAIAERSTPERAFRLGWLAGIAGIAVRVRVADPRVSGVRRLPRAGRAGAVRRAGRMDGAANRASSPASSPGSDRCRSVSRLHSPG